LILALHWYRANRSNNRRI